MGSRQCCQEKFYVGDLGLIAGSTNKTRNSKNATYVRGDMMSMTDIRFGVIGWGYWGPKIARNLDSLPHARVTMVADLDPRRLAMVLINQPSVQLTTEFEQMLRSNVDG